MDIKEKVVIITGASAGIGLETARLFAAQGARVVLAARSLEKLQQLANELNRQGGSGAEQALAVRADMRDAASIRAMVDAAVQHFGRVDVLINNAGQSVAGMIEHVQVEEMRQIFELNVIGPVEAMQAVIPVMRRQGGGIIVNVSSMTSKMAIPGLAGYASTKAALNLISTTARAELAGENIRVLTVLPRTTATEFGNNALGDRELRQRQRGNATRHVVVDPPEYVAQKILEAVRSETPEQYMDAG